MIAGCLQRIRSTLLIGLLCVAPFAAPFDALAATGTAPSDGGEGARQLLDGLLDRANQDGVSVIVINPSPGSVDLADEVSRFSQTGAPDPSAEFTVVMKAQSAGIEFKNRLFSKLKSLPFAWDQAATTINQASPNGSVHGFIRVFYWSVFLLLVGGLIEGFFYSRLFVDRYLRKLVRAEPQGYTEKIPVLIFRALFRFTGVVLSMVLAYLIGSIAFRDEIVTAPVQFTIAVTYIAYAVCRVVLIVWRIILVPYLAQYRIPAFNNADALKLFHWLWIGAVINVVADMFSIWMTEIARKPEIDAVLMFFFGLIVMVFNIVMVAANRAAISNALRSGRSISGTGTLMRIIARIWLPLSLGYFAFSFLQLTYRLVMDITLTAPLIAGAYGILISIIIAYGLMNYMIERIFSRKHIAVSRFEQLDNEISDEKIALLDESIDTYTESENLHVLDNYQDLAKRVAGILSVMFGAWALTRIWDFDEAAFFNRFIESGLDVMFILFVGYIVYQTVRIWIDNKIHEEGGDDIDVAPGDEGGASGTSRIATLLPLFRNFMLVLVAVSVLFSALLELGINVSPLFAGAGVIGLAIGFGSQALVRDIFSGAFFLFDDAFRKGEYIDIGEVKGTVESISVRSFQLRHHLGPLHTVPFGEIQHLTNYSRDWVMMKLPLRLTYDTDPEKVRKLIKTLGQQLAEDPEIGDNFLQPLKSQGVIEMQDSAMIVRVKFMTRPGDQWTIRKRVFQEIRDLFHREGIRFAHREVTVRLAGEDPGSLTAEQRKTIAAAALDTDDGGLPEGPDDFQQNSR